MIAIGNRVVSSTAVLLWKLAKPSGTYLRLEGTTGYEVFPQSPGQNK
jgi:hypothetical protein